MNDLCDVVLRSTDGSVFRVHRNKLSEKSEYFFKLFKWNEPREIILIPGICGEAMRYIFDYVYGGKIRLTGENILQVLIAADYFLLEEQVQKCRRFIAFYLTVKNCVTAYNIALLIDRLKIDKVCYRFICLHFEEIVRDEIESFMNLPMEALATILSEACLNVSNEEILWKVVVEWIKKDFRTRLHCLPYLLLSIFADFSKKSKADLHTDFRFINISQGPKVLENSFNFVKGEIVETIKLVNPEEFSVKIRQPKILYFVVKLSFHKNRSEIYLTFDNNLDIYRKFSFCNDFFPNFVMMIDHTAYMFNSFSRQNAAFDVLNQQWFSLPLTTRSRCSIVVLGNYIYALGGCLGDFPREFSPPIAERYNPNLLCWESIRPMRCNMVQAVAFDGFIFAIGEYDTGNNSSMIFEKYDPLSNIWQPLPAPKISRHNFAFEVYQDAIFVLGGRNDSGRYINSVEIFDPCTLVWSYGKRMICSYLSPRAHVLEDLLIIFDFYTNLSPICWNGNEWRKYEKLPNPDKYLFYCTKDLDVIAKLWTQSTGQEKTWQQFLKDTFL